MLVPGPCCADLTLIEFCMSLPPAAEEQAAQYLTQYLGDSGSAAAFTRSFLQRRRALPQAVASLAFPVSDAVVKDGEGPQAQAAQAGRSGGAAARLPDAESAATRSDLSAGRAGVASSKDGKKAKGKKAKGKQLDPALLGFSVSSNRIMKGEIEHVQD